MLVSDDAAKVFKVRGAALPQALRLMRLSVQHI